MFLALLQSQHSSLIRPFLDEILRARIRTLGIAEYKFQLDTSMYPRFAAQPGRHLMAAAGNVLERQWVVYDVGGHTSLVRTFRHLAFCLQVSLIHEAYLSTAREMGSILRRRQRDHLPGADLLLRPDARRGR